LQSNKQPCATGFNQIFPGRSLCWHGPNPGRYAAAGAIEMADWGEPSAALLV